VRGKYFRRQNQVKIQKEALKGGQRGLDGEKHLQSGMIRYCRHPNQFLISV
jgi:hypothetical protein